MTMETIEMQEGYLPLLTPEVVAERLSVEKSWVYRAARERIIPSVKVGRWVRFRREDIDAFIEKGGADEC